MKKVFTLIVLAFACQAQAQMVIEAPTLETLNAKMLESQANTNIQTYKTTLNTLETAKSALKTTEQLQEWNERVSKVSNALKDFKDITEIVNLTKKSYAEAEATVSFINDNRIENLGDGMGVADQTIQKISSSLQNMGTIITVLNSFVSSSLKMTDFERKTLIDQYKKDAIKEAYSISQMKKKYEMIIALNAL